VNVLLACGGRRESGFVALLEQRWEGLSGWAEDDLIERIGVEWVFGTYVDSSDVSLIGIMDETCGGVDGAGGADDEQDGGATELAVDSVHFEWNFAEPDDVWADGGVAGFADGEVIGVFVDGLVGEVLVGAGTAGLEEAAVHVMDAVRASAFVEIVYVLSAEVEVLPETLFDLCEGFVGRVWFGGEGVAASLRVEAPDEGGVCLPGFRGSDVFDAMAVPEAT
jgi:hypothetical protein